MWVPCIGCSACTRESLYNFSSRSFVECFKHLAEAASEVGLKLRVLVKYYYDQDRVGGCGMEKENSRWQKERRELAGINAFDVEFVELSEIEKYFPKKG